MKLIDYMNRIHLEVKTALMKKLVGEFIYN